MGLANLSREVAVKGNNSTGREEWRSQLGLPDWEETDADETILNYAGNGVEMEFELDREGRLKRWNVSISDGGLSWAVGWARSQFDTSRHRVICSAIEFPTGVASPLCGCRGADRRVSRSLVHEPGYRVSATRGNSSEADAESVLSAEA